MCQTDFIVHLPQHFDGILDVLKLAVALQIGAVYFYVIMDMGLVLMGIDHKLMLPF